jgi:hypothetical protein
MLYNGWRAEILSPAAHQKKDHAMPIAVSWAGCETASPFSTINPDLPFLDFGAIAPNATSAVQVLCLRFQGLSVQNILVWQDGTKCDLYSSSSGDATPQQAAPVPLAIAITSGTFSTFQSGPTAWSAIPTTQSAAISLGSATIDSTQACVSEPFGIAIVAPAADNTDYRNFRLLASFETTDQPHQ